MINVFKNILEIALSSSVMIIIVLFIRLLLKNKLNFKILSFLWLLVIFRLVLPITLDLGWHIDGIFVREQFQETDATYIMDAEYNQQPDYINQDYEASDNNDINLGLVEIATNNAISKVEQFSNNVNIWAILAIIWLAGVSIAFLISIVNIYSFNQKVKKSKNIANQALMNMIEVNRHKLNIRPSVKIFECDYIDTPVTYGVVFPKILLPVWFMDSISVEKLNLIILHELVHIKNKDVVKNYLWFISRIIYWFNPILRYAFRIYHDDMELLCDEIVLKNSSILSRFVYTQSLIDAVKISKGEMNVPIALSFYENRTNLRKRVENMMKPTRKTKTASFLAIAIAIVMIFVCFTTACQPSSEEILLDSIEDIQIEQSKVFDDSENHDVEALEPLNIDELKKEVWYNQKLEANDFHVFADSNQIGTVEDFYSTTFAFSRDELEGYNSDDYETNRGIKIGHSIFDVANAYKSVEFNFYNFYDDNVEITKYVDLEEYLNKNWDDNELHSFTFSVREIDGKFYTDDEYVQFKIDIGFDFKNATDFKEEYKPTRHIISFRTASSDSAIIVDIIIAVHGY